MPAIHRPFAWKPWLTVYRAHAGRHARRADSARNKATFLTCTVMIDQPWLNLVPGGLPRSSKGACGGPWHICQLPRNSDHPLEASFWTLLSQYVDFVLVLQAFFDCTVVAIGGHLATRIQFSTSCKSIIEVKHCVILLIS